jgi:hypothetical protein
MDLVHARDNELMQLLPAWWTQDERAATVKSFNGQCLIRSVVGIVHMELQRIKATEDGNRI